MLTRIDVLVAADRTGLISVGIVVLIVILTRSKFVSRKIDNLVEKIIARRITKQTKKRTVDQVLKISPDFAVYEILVEGESALAETTLTNANLSKMFIHVLKIDRGNKTIDFPSPDFLMKVGDVLIVYGKIKSIQELAQKSK